MFNHPDMIFALLFDSEEYSATASTVQFLCLHIQSVNTVKSVALPGQRRQNIQRETRPYSDPTLAWFTTTINF